jgi:putative DNA methylase
MSSAAIRSPRKLIEVALPLNAINLAAAREKSIRHGHPSTLHLWWARRPLAAARAVIFAQLVNDPGFQQGAGFRYGVNKKEAAIERKRLFKIIEDLVIWENTNDEEVLERARIEIRRSWREVCELNKDHPQAVELFNSDNVPGLHDPFAGGGAIPLEAQRLGLKAYASDLNPVAVLINKAMIEIPPKFGGRYPASLVAQRNANNNLGFDQSWPGLMGIVEDVRFYGTWIRQKAQERIGHFYPPVEITADMAKERPDLTLLIGQKLTVIAWIWARTVKSPNRAFSDQYVPLASTFVLSSKPGKESYVVPVVEGPSYRFTVVKGTPPLQAQEGTKVKGRGANFRCVLSDVPISGDYIKAEGQSGRIGTRLMAVVAEGVRGRVYLAPTSEMEALAAKAEPSWKPDVAFLQQALGFRVGNYGMTKWSDLFTKRQLLALTTFSDLISEVREKIRNDALAGGMLDDNISLESGGTETTAYAEAVCVYLAFAIDKSCVYWNTLCPWLNQPKNEIVGNAFSRQAVPMVWDFAEANPFSDSGGNIEKQVSYVCKVLEDALCPNQHPGNVQQANASEQTITNGKIVSTDPPYYDNIGYADLSDFFYVWLRRALRTTMPKLFAIMATPKIEELVATPARHGGLVEAEKFFLDGMTTAIQRIAEQSHPSAPITIYYSFKQADTEVETGTSSTGWETFLDACFRAGLQISATWPARTERPGRMRDFGSNALASSIVLACRRRPMDAPAVSRREFLRELNRVLPEALDEMTKGAGSDQSPVAPVDLSQAIIGPGMAVFSRYSAVLEADGTPMSVRTALQMINRFLAEDDFDADTQFCLHWFEQHGWNEGAFGEADVLARSKSTSIESMKEAGVLQSGSGRVRLLKWSEYPTDWDPTDTRTSVWEAVHQIIRGLRQGGYSESGAFLASLEGKAEAVRQLAYRLYTLCERLGHAEDARSYNDLITSWTGIETAAASGPTPPDPQGTLFES